MVVVLLALMAAACMSLARLDREARKITVDDATGFKAGDDLVIYDVQAGDDCKVDAIVDIRRAGAKWQVQATSNVSVEPNRPE